MMGLRLIKPALAELFHPTLIDPRTRQPLEALYVGRRGPVWPVIGASGEDDDDSDPEDDDEDPEGEPEDDDANKGDVKARLKALEDEKSRHYKKRKEAEKERDELRQQLGLKNNEGKSELEKAQAELEQTSKESATRAAKLKTLHVENAFLRANKINWHDSADALSQIDMSEVEMDEDGKVDVKSLTTELKRLAKAKPYLVKSDKDDDDEDDDEDEDEDDDDSKKSARKPVKKTGAKLNRAKGKKANEPTREDLAKRFPALKR